ncbi:velvet factor [Halteromyces radiatus]|uniref:velvet factor n=1 Tax=Halteromyces radiatus TaxID=101107 RepID=UPI00221EBA6F|nr:velvet factor [Halteromyces radiatus]KAI8080062.1 velvet factor [Halteromyces radiatus]
MGSLPGLPIYFNLVIRQQPLQSRTCGVGDKVDRRPIDPPLIIELQMHNGYHQLLLPEEYMTDLFMTAVLVPAARTTTTSSSTQQQVDLSLHSQLTVGRTVSSLYLFKDLDYIPKCFFVFSDLSIRVEGRYRFQLSLFQIQG